MMGNSVMGLKLYNANLLLNTLRPRQNGRHLADDIFKCIFRNENVWISINISLKVVSMGLIDNIPALVQIMAWRRSGDKPLSEPMMDSLLTHICVTRPQWVKRTVAWYCDVIWSKIISHCMFVRYLHIVGVVSGVYQGTMTWYVYPHENRHWLT